MPNRTFTHHDLTLGITLGDYNAMSPEDKLAFDRALMALWVSNARTADQRYLSSDYDRVGSNRRFQLGE
jgi:hypothetical protein